MNISYVKPLLTIAIPTWQRAPFLALTLAQLQREVEALAADAKGTVEILISDNASPDDTPAVVAQAKARGLQLNYVRNAENIGSDANIAQCFNLAQGQYVLILGDDDLLADGTLNWLLQTLMRKTWGVVCLRAYGFNQDFRREYPGRGGDDCEFADAGDFIVAIGSFIALISSCVINRQLLAEIDAQQFCGGNLVQVHLVIRAALKAPVNLFSKKYLIAYQRNNAGFYDFSKVLVLELGRILDSYQAQGLSSVAIRRFETRLIIGYYPFYLLRQRFERAGDLQLTLSRFTERFNQRWLFHVWLAPILKWPRPLALIWGAGATVIGRMVNGDLWRGITFISSRLRFKNGKKENH